MGQPPSAVRIDDSRGRPSLKKKFAQFILSPSPTFAPAATDDASGNARERRPRHTKGPDARAPNAGRTNTAEAGRYSFLPNRGVQGIRHEALDFPGSLHSPVNGSAGVSAWAR